MLTNGETLAVITWFQNIENKDISSFIKFDIVDFYPSISKDISINAINFAKSITPIDDKNYMPANRYYSTKMKSGSFWS